MMDYESTGARQEHVKRRGSVPMLDHEHTIKSQLRHLQRTYAALQRAALELRIAGWTYEQIAVAFGVRDNDACRMVNYALQKCFERVRWSADDRHVLKRGEHEEVEDEWDDDGMKAYEETMTGWIHHVNLRSAALQRAALELRMAEWTYEQIAAALGVSTHKACSMVYRELMKRSERVSERAHHRYVRERGEQEVYS